MSIKARIAELERKLNLQRSTSLEIVLIEGALPREPSFAEAGGHTFARDLQHESLEGFVSRCATEARGFEETLLVVGGLGGPMPDTLEEFLATLHFDEVPPEETQMR